MLRLYWRLRNWLRPGVIMREPTRDELLGWAAVRKYPHAQKCVKCHGKFWAVKGARVCGKLDCYIAHKTHRRMKQTRKPQRSVVGRGR